MKISHSFVRLQTLYCDYNQFVQFDLKYRTAEKLGFIKAEFAWEANPIVVCMPAII